MFLAYNLWRSFPNLYSSSCINETSQPGIEWPNQGNISYIALEKTIQGLDIVGYKMYYLEAIFLKFCEAEIPC